MGENREGAPDSPSPGRRSAYPQRRLADEIMPYLRDLDNRNWTPEEREFLEGAERRAGAAAGGVGEASVGRAGADDR